MDNQLKSCCAGFYEMPIVQTLLGNQWHPGGPALTRKLANAVLIGRHSHVLDIASGSGASARVLTQHFGCHVVGLDYSAKNTAQANTMAAEAGLLDRNYFVQGDAEHLPFDAESFDVVICECSLCVFPNLSVTLEEIHRVLRPGGHLGISDVVVNETIPESLQDLFGQVLCIGGALSVDGYRDAFATAGFTSVRSRDASNALSDMIARIERRAGTIENFLDAEKLEIHDGLTVPRSSITEARNFVKAGGVGYALVSGRKPRDQ